MYTKGLSVSTAMSGVMSVINVVVAALSGVGHRAVTAVSKAARYLLMPTQFLRGPTLILVRYPALTGMQRPFCRIGQRLVGSAGRDGAHLAAPGAALPP